MVEGSAALAGPIIAGLLLEVGDPAVVFLAMAVVLAASAVTVSGGSARHAPAVVVRGSPIRTLLGGVSMVLSERRTRVIVGLGGMQSIVDGALDVLSSFWPSSYWVSASQGSATSGQ
jgi:hypothetical protein